MISKRKQIAHTRHDSFFFFCGGNARVLFKINLLVVVNHSKRCKSHLKNVEGSQAQPQPQLVAIEICRRFQDVAEATRFE